MTSQRVFIAVRGYDCTNTADNVFIMFSVNRDKKKKGGSAMITLDCRPERNKGIKPINMDKCAKRRPDTQVPVTYKTNIENNTKFY